MAFLISNLIWGAAGPVIKYTLDYIPPATFVFIRLLLVGIIIFPYMIYELKKHDVHHSDYLNLFLLGVFSETTLLITFWAINLSSALDVTVIGVMGTILTIYCGHYFFKEKVDRKIEIGLAFAILGTFIVIFEPILNIQAGTLSATERVIGNLLAVLYNITWVIFVLWSKMVMGDKSTPLKKTLKFMHLKPMKYDYPPSLITGITFYVGVITVLPFAIYENISKPGLVDIMNIDYHGWIGLMYMVLLSSITAYTLHQWALHKGSVTDSAVWAYTGTIFAFPVAYLLLGEVPNTYMLIGGLLITLGILIAESRNT
ncbi:MAG: hypothetical protein UU80_C0032G0021 [candidate division WWE3 bacterium GW2011_GWA1_41_8]|uniref:EamA domain-containing protein n=1 Tax=candidate division WWE3 bacterium GW2011_GWA1_41_8 TaxID=1619103 RepID=A0A0G0XA55_UNCKA|nr:MAG: hypothetical protein UU80_C0032G0021 [candidate division WWE3 bacterium GW2011_GWA1_41_8]